MTQEQALEILKTGANVFLTGEPGSGKTHTINRYVNYLKSHGIETAITASTGIAATHIGGMTIHSWSGIGIKNKLNKTELRSIATNDYVEKRVGKAKVLIIDEISMLAPKTLQMIDAICREVKQNPKPFGGLQVVLVGDFFQLPPVLKYSTSDDLDESLFEETAVRFAYESLVWKQADFVACYLTEQYRQDDDLLLSILSKIRSNNFDSSSLSIVKQRHVNISKSPENAPKLYSHNIDVDFVNNQKLSKIPGEAKLFSMIAIGQQALIKSMKKGCLSPENLYLKVGASVMFTKNNSKEGYFNGTLGEVSGFDKDSNFPLIKIKNGRQIKVSTADWTVEESGSIKACLTQIPLRLAWAITVHKSQGISLDEAVIDLSKVFEFGQGYVALSRVRRLSGIYLLGWNTVAFQVDAGVLSKDEEFKKGSKNGEKVFSKFSSDGLKKIKEDFIILSGGDINASKIVAKNIKNKTSTFDETLELWNEGKDLAQIAKTRGLSEETILNHLEKLVKIGRIKRHDILRIMPVQILDALPKIYAIFRMYDDNKLSPVFNHFNGKFLFNELKIARMTMK